MSAKSSALAWKTISWVSCWAYPWELMFATPIMRQPTRTLLTTLLQVARRQAAGCNYFMGVPCADDVMLNYQSTSFHDAVAVRRLFGLRPAPEFAAWLETCGWPAGSTGMLDDSHARQRILQQLDTVLVQAAGTR